ncbi:hypothetical protein [Gelria sp. Kuro-4]|uniref:LA_3696 family protein n=1 Tax=Gelria sp. Kuro-4 TaxID=2796927 RepID=UPI001C80856E|nr:hypothetical protein [Gelria sp. Kuro-4]
MPETLRQRLGEDGARDLVELVNASLASAKEVWNETAVERLERRLAETKAELIRWMFVFWVGQVGITVALLTLRH